jgi:hypothetical protein
VWLVSGLQNNTWFQFWWLSNDFRTPRVLACPADTARRSADNWSASPDGGFLHASYRNAGVSYPINLEAIGPEPLDFVASDRNVKFTLSAGGSGCSSGIRYNGAFSFYGLSTGLEPGLIHGEEANFLRTDGAVEELSSRAFIKRGNELDRINDNGLRHYLVPN